MKTDKLDYEQFGVKKLQEEFEYTDLIIDRVSEMLDNSEDQLSDEEYRYQLHYKVSMIVSAIKAYINSFDFNDAYDLALKDLES